MPMTWNDIWSNAPLNPRNWRTPPNDLMNRQVQNFKGYQQSKKMLKDIANRKIEGNSLIQYPVSWTTWTPSGANKIYQATAAITKPLWDGTWITLTEGVGIIDADFKGSFFEAYSAQKFEVEFTTFFVDKDNAVASAEAAWTERTNPKDYLLAHHTDVVSVGKTVSISARPIASGLWYVKFQDAKILNRLFKEYLKQTNDIIRDATKRNVEPMEGYLEIVVVASTTSDVFLQQRTRVELLTAQADLGSF